MKHPYSSMPQRHKLQWLYASITIIVLALGWKFPALGFLVAGAMLGGIISGPLAGRWFCGNLCPRGGFLERIIGRYAKGSSLPRFFTSAIFRVAVILFLFAMLTINVKSAPLDWRQWGFAFWLICFVTTAAGAVLAFFGNARAWCAICPMGTVQNWFGGKRYLLAIERGKCKSCLVCEKKCPMNLHIIDLQNNGLEPQASSSPDCIRCGECIAACPAKTLHFVKK